MINTKIGGEHNEKLLSLALALALLSGLAACGSGSADPSDVTASLAKAQEVAAGLTSAKTEMDMDMSYTITADGQNLDVSTTMSMSTEVIMEPMTAYALVSMDVMGVQMDVYSYVRQEGEGYVAYASLDGTNWTPQELTEDQLAQYNAAQSVEFYIRAAQGFKYSGEEELDGVKLHRYDGELTGDMLNEAVELSGMDTMLSSYGVNGDTVFEGSMPMSIWLDAETFAPVRYELDMSQVIAGYMQGMFEAEGASMENASILVSIRLSELNAIESIETPAGIE